MLTAIIPARGGSQAIPRKNIVNVGGYPLIAYTIAACKLAKNIDRVIVSTEDEEIASVAKKYGGEVPFMRPSEFSQNRSSDLGFLGHFFENIDVEEVALMRPTTPFRDPFLIDKVIEEYFSMRDEITGLRTVEEIRDNPYKVCRLQENICVGFFDHFKGEKHYNNMPRQIFPKAFTGNGHIDIVKKETVLCGRIFGDKLFGRVCDKMIDIDSPFDLKLAQQEIESGSILLDFIKKRNDYE